MRRRKPSSVGPRSCGIPALLGVLLVGPCSLALSEHPEEAASDTEAVKEEYPSLVDEKWRSVVFTPVKADRGFSFHKQTFVLPASWSSEYAGAQTECIFQLSFKVRILQTRFYGAFTATSFWQAYDKANSSPFRETNYNPQLFYRLTPSNSKFEHWGFDFGLEHNSNGQTIERSRSWNRLYFAPHYRFKRSFIRAKIWYRFPEDECEFAGETDCDNNPDITDYYGHFEVSYDLQIGTRQKPPLLHLLAGGNIAERKGRLSLTFSYPAFSKDVYWHLWVFHGYSESLIDYDQIRSRVGVGFQFIH